MVNISRKVAVCLQENTHSMRQIHVIRKGASERVKELIALLNG